MRRIRLAILAALTLALTGCGGGSDSLRPETTDSQAQVTVQADTAPEELTRSVAPQNDEFSEEDPLAEERKQAEQAITGPEAENARKQAVSEMTATEDQLGESIEDARTVGSPYFPHVSAGAYVEFDGRDVRVHLTDYYHWSPVVLSSMSDEVDNMAVPSDVAGHSRRTWTLSGEGSLAVVSVRWNDRDNSDYLAAGWWVRETPYSSDLEAKVFFDGAEFRGPLPDSMTLPLRGQAVYQGEAAGIYQTQDGVLCTAFPCDIPASSGSVGEFVADAKLVANFANGDIEGCVGCREGIRFTPADYDAQSGRIERGSTVTKDYLFWLHRAGFLESPYSLGTFAGDLTVAPLGEHAAGYGFWQGRFSNISDSSGSPRLVGATLQGEFEDGAAVTRFSGFLSAESTAFGGGR